MTLITITETGHFTDQPNATLSFDHGAPQPITIADPFGNTEEERLRWYFEDHLRFPFTHEVRARQAAESIVAYGEALFAQVFTPHADLYARYQVAVQNGLQTLHFDIVGSPEFHQLHWEALREPGRDPFVLHATMVRRSTASLRSRLEVQGSATINLLVVTARPHGRRDVGYRTISRPLIEGLRQVQAPVRVDLVRPGTYRALVEHLRRSRDEHGVGYYHIIHFDLHGAVLTHAQLAQLGSLSPQTYQARLTDRYARPDLTPPPDPAVDLLKAYLFFEAESTDDVDPAEADELTRLLREYHMPIAVLNACQSGQQIGSTETSLGSRLLQAGMQTVMAMGYSVTVSAAALMMQTLYQSLLRQHNLLVAFREARTALHHEKKRRAHFNQYIPLEDWLLPIVYQPQGDLPTTLPLRQASIAEQAIILAQHEARYQAREPVYGFVGRDVDILQIEKRVLNKHEGKQRNLLLVRGMGGAGKTTLLQHLGQWWQSTGLVEEVFYFGYDEKAFTRDQIVDQMARRLLNQTVPQGMAVSPAYAQFQALLPALQQRTLAQRLRAERHLLILDNLESITGASLAIPNTLPASEQASLRGFLADLLDGRTLVLLGSRGGERWLTEGSNAPLRPTDVYELPGLDDEAVSTLAERIMERHQATHYRTDMAFLDLIKLLDGFPLALEVVLANLPRQSPQAVLDALRAGDVALDRGTSQSRTESIMRCLDYSHSNLSPEAQGLLACLAPFSAVLNTRSLASYADYLRQQPALAHLPWERLPAVLEEATDWGLLSPHPELPDMFLSLQPIFPYFLRSRWQIPEHAETQQAVAVAFRQHYEKMSGTLDDLLNSQDAQKRQRGQVMVSLEYENLMTALHLALDAQMSILKFYKTLSDYLDATNEERRGLDLGEAIRLRLQAYPEAAFSGLLGFEFISVLDDIACRRLTLKQYAAAEASYQETLRLLDALTTLGREKREKAKAGMLHQLGQVAQGQRQWAQAEQYYQQALDIKIKFHNRYSQAGTYHHLGMLAEEQQQWELAEQYYLQALAIWIEFPNCYEQADTYHHLGIVAQAQGQGEQARDYFLKALAITAAFENEHELTITLRSLGRLWRASGDTDLPQAIASILQTTPEDVEARLSSLLSEET
jgi:tetratricopeptide (TPR) repeat protein